jgi:hypothetical protein
MGVTARRWLVVVSVGWLNEDVAVLIEERGFCLVAWFFIYLFIYFFMLHSLSQAITVGH